MDTRFDRIGETVVQYKERRTGEMKLVYERKIVKKILLGLGVEPTVLGVERPEKQDNDGSFMTLAWLYDRYPTFPLLLTTRETWTPSIIDFFKVRSRKNSFWEIWSDITDGFQDEKRDIGCVFPFPQTSDLGHGIVHTHNLPYIGFNQEVEAVYLQRRCADGAVLTLERLDSFINRLRPEWEPM